MRLVFPSISYKSPPGKREQRNLHGSRSTPCFSKNWGSNHKSSKIHLEPLMRTWNERFFPSILQKSPPWKKATTNFAWVTNSNVERVCFSIYITQVNPLENGNHEVCMGHPLSLRRTRNVHNTLFQLLYVNVQLTYRVLIFIKLFQSSWGGHEILKYITRFSAPISSSFSWGGLKFLETKFSAPI